MRLIKMFGLAALAAVAAMAFVGASTASATELEDVVLCKAHEDPCNNGHFGAGTVIHGQLASGTKAVLLSDVGDVSCTSSTTLGETKELLAHAKITSLAFGGCTTFFGFVNCSVTVEHLNYLALVLLNDAHNGYHMVATELENGRPQAFVNCGSGFVECTYRAPESGVLFTVELNASDVVLSVLQTLERVGTEEGCGTTSVWHAKYLTRCLDGAANLVGCWPAMHKAA